MHFKWSTKVWKKAWRNWKITGRIETISIVEICYNMQKSQKAWGDLQTD